MCSKFTIIKKEENDTDISTTIDHVLNDDIVIVFDVLALKRKDSIIVLMLATPRIPSTDFKEITCNNKCLASKDIFIHSTMESRLEHIEISCDTGIIDFNTSCCDTSQIGSCQ